MGKFRDLFEARLEEKWGKNEMKKIAKIVQKSISKLSVMTGDDIEFSEDDKKGLKTIYLFAKVSTPEAKKDFKIIYKDLIRSGYKCNIWEDGKDGQKIAILEGVQALYNEGKIRFEATKALNEGTTATITTFIDGLYKTSILQYDGYESFMAPELKKYWDSPKKASELTTKSGELRGVYQGKAEYYKDRKLLQVTKNVNQAASFANDSKYKYFYDGKDWYWAIKSLRSDFSKMTKI